MNPPKAYLFDIGNVILGFDFNIAMQRLREIGIASEDPRGAISDIIKRYEHGEFDDEEFVELAMKQLGFSGSEDEFIRIWQEIFHENRPMIETIRELAETGQPLYLLSNTNGLHIQHIVRSFPVFDAFKAGVYSHEAKSMKPDPPMYEQAIERFKLIPEETLYIDDLPANIETGKRLGFRSFQYDITDHATFLRSLESPSG